MILDEEEKVFNSDEQNPTDLLTEFLNHYDFYNDKDRERITNAWNLLIEKTRNLKRSCGTPYYVHPLRVCDILAQNKMDAETIVAAILHTIREFGITEQEITEKFGEQTEKIIEGVNKIMNLQINSKTLQQADAIRKMLFAMVDDIRIILVKLADRLDRIRHIKSVDKEKQRILAEEIIDIWAPLADRLGMQTEKNEFEDLSLRYTNPEAYLQIKEIVNQSKSERSAYLENATNKIKSSAYKMGMEVTVMSRAKHFYSIYQKMRKRNKSAGELYDLLALRILCNTNAECYTLIGIVHGLWTPLEGRFKDYIAVPKANGYQSLHTTVMCDGHPLEIQIRTYEMHNMAEHGIASHWLYKKGTNHDLVEADKLEIFNKLQKLKESAASEAGSGATGFMDADSFKNFKNEFLGDEIYVFTPKGDVKKLPHGATAIDFAYAIHSAVGEKIIAAKADGKIIPLNKALQNTQIVEIITNPNAHPTETQLSIVKTSRAHQRIHSWLMSNDPTFSERLALQRQEDNTLSGSQNSGNLQNSSDSVKNSSGTQNQKQRKQRPKKNPNPELAEKRVVRNVLVQGQRNVMYTMAQCCKPYYPNLICGYVTRSKGISIHRADCLVYQSNPEKDKRSVEVAWEEKE